MTATIILAAGALVVARSLYRHRTRERELDRIEGELAYLETTRKGLTNEDVEVIQQLDQRFVVAKESLARVKQEWLADNRGIIDRLKGLTSQQIEMSKADRAFGILSALLPKRIAQEELGDALEDIRRREAEGRPPFEIRLKIVATVFWVSLHGLEHLAGRLGRVVSKVLGLADLFKVFKR